MNLHSDLQTQRHQQSLYVYRVSRPRIFFMKISNITAIYLIIHGNGKCMSQSLNNGYWIIILSQQMEQNHQYHFEMYSLFYVSESKIFLLRSLWFTEMNVLQLIRIFLGFFIKFYSSFEKGKTFLNNDIDISLIDIFQFLTLFQ